MSLRSFSQLIASLSLFACMSVSAAPLVVNIANISSWGELGDEANTVLTYDVGANATITSMSYDVNVTANRPSWLSELGLAFTNSTVTRGVLLAPGGFDDFAGTATYAASIDLVAESLSFMVGSDGILRLEFFEGFDDSGLNPDGVWNFGTLTFNVEAGTPEVPGDPGTPGEVPEPATALLIAAGLGMLGYRRRRAAGAAAV